jgi:SSS family solute:Na+ symporter
MVAGDGDECGGRVIRQAWYFNGYFPWLGMLFCAPIIGLCIGVPISTSCSARWAHRETVARQGSIFAAFLRFFPVYLFIVPGLICYALAKAARCRNWRL